MQFIDKSLRNGLVRNGAFQDREIQARAPESS